MPRALLFVRHSATSFYLLSAMVAGAVALRGIASVFVPTQATRWIVVGLLVCFSLLLATEPLLSRHWIWYPPAYLTVQIGLVLTLLLMPPHLDFFAALGLPLSAQALRSLPSARGFRWVGGLTFAVACALLFTHGWLHGLALFLLFAAGYGFVASYVFVTSQAEAAHAESQRLLSDLQQAHTQLHAYAAQAEHLATMEERHRLARDLHDSLTQTLYSLTLQSEAAVRELGAGAETQIFGHLRTIRRMAQQGLGDLRALLFQLRPPDLAALGLLGALQDRLDAVEARSGLETTLISDGDDFVPDSIEDGFYRIAQEALNNVIKHAQARHVTVSLQTQADRHVLEIIDDGCGLDRTARRAQRGLGMQSMHERARQLGGTLTVDSAPGEGTRVHVEVRR